MQEQQQERGVRGADEYKCTQQGEAREVRSLAPVTSSHPITRSILCKTGGLEMRWN